MIITNRTSDVLTFMTLDSSKFTSAELYLEWDWISPGQTINKGQGVHSVVFWVAKGKVLTGDSRGMINNQRLDYSASPAFLNRILCCW